MADRDTDAEKEDYDPKKRQHEKMIADHKGIMARGFSKEQAAQQLVSKYAMTIAEVNAVIDQGEQDKD
jgi:hypothetical protein